MIPWLAAGQPFPPVRAALAHPNGLLAASRELSVDRLLAAYTRGIFPWYSTGEPVLWWSPHPRMVLFTDEFRVSRTFGKTLRRVARSDSIELRANSAFEAVMRACAAPRGEDAGTWITAEMIAAYTALHRLGVAVSIETWKNGELVGGLYGISLGRMFYGESMFTRAADASKIALAALVRLLLSEEVRVIDCQQNTRHLASLGAREIGRADFLAHVKTAVECAPIDWRAYMHRPLNALLTETRTD
ncbi:MAG: leucyl/phenylalanyl-tRNA--protein transferase [Burkholderiaceae bacterium]